MSGRDYALQFIYVAVAIGAVFGVRALLVRKPVKQKKTKKKATKK